MERIKTSRFSKPVRLLLAFEPCKFTFIKIIAGLRFKRKIRILFDILLRLFMCRRRYFHFLFADRFYYETICHLCFAYNSFILLLILCKFLHRKFKYLVFFKKITDYSLPLSPANQCSLFLNSTLKVVKEPYTRVIYC